MEETIVRLAREVAEKRFGKYRGFVVDNADPEKRARLKLRIPSVLADQDSDWALPCLPYGGLDQPTTRMLRTHSGHIMQFDDADGEEQFRLFHPSEAEMIIDPDGTISLTDASGAVLKMDAANNEIVIEDANGNIMTMDSSGTRVEDANGNVIEMAAAGITAEAPKIVLKGSQVHLGDEGGEPVIKGQSFLSLFATHIHTVAPVVGGPTSPPIPQGEASTLSTTVKTI